MANGSAFVRRPGCAFRSARSPVSCSPSATCFVGDLAEAGSQPCLRPRRRDAGRTLLSVREEEPCASLGDPSAGQAALPSAARRQHQQDELIKETESLQLVDDAAAPSSVASSSGAANWRLLPGSPRPAPPPKRVLMTHSTPSSSGTKRPVWDDDWVADLIDQEMAELKDPGSLTLKRGRPEFGGAADPQVTGATISRPPLSRGPSVRRRTG